MPETLIWKISRSPSLAGPWLIISRSWPMRASPFRQARRPDEVLNDPDLIQDRELADFFTILPAIAPAGRTMRINVTIDEATLALADRAAGDRGLTRSAFIAEACRRFAVGETFGLRNIVDAYQKRGVAPNVTARVNEAQQVFARQIADLVGDRMSGIVTKKGRARL